MNLRNLVTQRHAVMCYRHRILREMSLRLALFSTVSALFLAAPHLPAAGKKEDHKAIAASLAKLLDAEGELIIFSLRGAKNIPIAKNFHDYEILGGAVVKDKADQKALFESLSQSIHSTEDPFACFNPRHGLRFTKGEQTIEILICFQCESSRVYGVLGLDGFSHSKGAAPVFNAFLDKNHVPRDKE